MARTVFATFRTETEAERALSMIASETRLLDSAIVGNDSAGRLTLDSLDLSAEQRSACEDQMKRGGYLMIAQGESDEAADAVLRVLHSSVGDNAPLVIAEASGPAQSSPGPAPKPPSDVVEQERIPLVEEDLRVGKREVVRGRARVHSHMTEAPVSERVELSEEEIRVNRRPASRRLTGEEVAQSGLLQDRVFQFTSMREEAVVSKQPFVREELVVSKHVEQRVEEIHDTVRRTEVEMERIEPEEAGDRRG